jgi:hypothetical protein
MPEKKLFIFKVKALVHPLSFLKPRNRSEYNEKKWLFHRLLRCIESLLVRPGLVINHKHINNMNIIWRIAGIAVVAGLALFLLSLVVKFLLIGMGLFLLVRVVGPRLMGRAFGRMERGGWQGADIIAIDNPAYHAGRSTGHFDRVIAIR